MNSNMKKKRYAFLLSALMLTSSLFAAVDVTSGLKLHYTFDTAPDGAIPDVSGNGYTATMLGGASLAEGKSGQALLLTNVADYVVLPEGIVADVEDFTISYWVNLNTLQYWGRVFDFGSGQDINSFMAPNDGHFRFVIKKDTETGEQILNSNIKVNTNEWTHIAVTGHYGGEFATITMYVNGVVAAMSDKIFTSRMADMGVTTQNYLGKSQWPDPTIDGRIDDFRLYKRALTQDEVMVLIGYPEPLIDAYNTLILGNTIDVTENLTLPTTIGSDGVTITWASSDPMVVEPNGTIHRADFFRKSATLTATLSITLEGVTTSINKYFDVVVYPVNEPSEYVAVWNFTEENVTRENGVVKVKDEISGYEATCVGGADIVLIGTDEVFNVLSIGSQSGQYLDLGEEIGEAIYGLTDYTISLFYRKDTTDGSASRWSTENGKPLYVFSNSLDLEGEKNGAMYYEPRRARHVCTPDNYGSENDNKVEAVGTRTPQGSWHNITYSQIDGVGTLYFNGIEVGSASMQSPMVALKKNVTGRKGTLYNMLGRPAYKADAYLTNCLMYGFKVFSVGLTEDDLEDVLAIQSTIAALDNAYENTNYDVPTFMNLRNLLSTAEKALAIGYEPALPELQAAIEVAETAASQKVDMENAILVLQDAIDAYNEAAAIWIELGKVLASFDDEIELNYPGLADFQAAIAAAQAQYDAFVATQDIIDGLAAARIAYLQTQPASGANPVDYTWAITNANFEENVGGGLLDLNSNVNGQGATINNGSIVIPKGWTLYMDNIGWANAVYYTNGPADGKYAYETWSAEIHEFNLYQTINLNPGYYVLSGQVRTNAQPPYDMHIYCSTDEYTYTSKSLEEDKVLTGDNWTSVDNWQTLYTVIYTKGGNARVGFRSTGFMQFDNMRLAYYGADEPDVTTFTAKLANPGFEEGTMPEAHQGIDSTSVYLKEGGVFFAPVGWTVYLNLDTLDQGLTNLRYVESATEMAEGTKAYEMWNGAIKTFKLSQAVKAPASGFFRLTADVRCNASSPSKTDPVRFDARIFAKVANLSPLESLKFGEGDTSFVHGGGGVWDSKNAWQTLTLDFAAGIGQTINLGIVSSSFMQIDNFTLTYLGVPADLYNTPVGLDRTSKPVKAYTVYGANGVINIAGLTNERVSVFDIAGRQIAVKNPSSIAVKEGIYFVKVDSDVYKVLVK